VSNSTNSGAQCNRVEPLVEPPAGLFVAVAAAAAAVTVAFAVPLEFETADVSAAAVETVAVDEVSLDCPNTGRLCPIKQTTTATMRPKRTALLETIFKSDAQ
jgi:hypothetical protein